MSTSNGRLVASNMILRLHSEGVSLEHVDVRRSLVTLAADLGNLRLLQCLHEQGIDVLRQLRTGETALMKQRDPVKLVLFDGSLV